MAQALSPDDRSELLSRLSGDEQPATPQGWLEAAEFRYRHYRHWQLSSEWQAVEPSAKEPGEPEGPEGKDASE